MRDKQPDEGDGAAYRYAGTYTKRTDAQAKSPHTNNVDALAISAALAASDGLKRPHLSEKHSNRNKSERGKAYNVLIPNFGQGP